MQRENEIVVLVHGLGGSRLDMWPISRRLKQLGFGVLNWGYRSIGNRIETHAERLGQAISELDNESRYSRVNLVTHSMGGIIARTMFSHFQFAKLGRVVMLAPPHRGSHMARKLTRWIGWATPSLTQLSDEPGSYVNRLPNSLERQGIEFGIVEATKDRVIAPGYVRLDGHRELASVDGHHGILTWYSETIELVENFLLEGSFQPLVQAREKLPAAADVV